MFGIEKGKVNKSHIIVILIVCLSMAMCIVNIVVKEPMSWLDEETHFARCIELARGYFFYAPDGDLSQVGGYVDAGESYFIDCTHSRISTDENHIFFAWWREYKDFERLDEDIFRAVTNTVPYVPVVYLPYVIVGIFARIFSIKPVVEFLLMRIAGMLFSYALYILAICRTKKARIPLAIMLLNPMVFCTFSAVTADAYLVAASALFLASLYELYVDVLEKKPITALRMVELLIVIALITCSKMPNFIMIGLILPVMHSMYVNKYEKKKLIITGVYVLVAAILTVLWFVLVKDVNTGAFWHKNVDTYEQLKYISANKGVFLSSLVYAIASFPFTTMQMGYMIKTYYEVPTFFAILFYIGLYLSARIGDKNPYYITDKKKDISIFTIWGNILMFSYSILIFVMLFLQFTDIGERIITGVQPRYFMPIFIYYIFNFSYNYEKRTANKFIIALSAVLPVISYIAILNYAI